MPHILAATDLSPRADRAVERAFRLAHDSGARLTVLTVTDDAIPEPLASRLKPDTEAHLVQFCDSLSRDGTIPYEARVEAGDPPVDIPRIAGEIGADLVVLGLHRRRAFLDGVRETTLERVVRLSAPTVLLVREHADHDYSRVLAAVDFSPASTAALIAARTLAPQAEIRAVHAVHVPHDPAGHGGDSFVKAARTNRELWMDTADLPDGVAPPEIVEGALGAVLDAEVGRFRPDVLAIGAHAHNSLVDMVLGSVARDLVRDPPADLLLAKPAAEAAET